MKKFCKRKFLKTVGMNKFCHVKFLHPGLDYGYSRLKLDAWKSRLKRRVGHVAICLDCDWSHLKLDLSPLKVPSEVQKVSVYISVYTCNIYTYLPAHDILIYENF